MGVTNGTTEANGHPSSFAAKHNLPSHFIGGNHLGVAPPSAVKDFVAKHDGHSVITSVSRHTGHFDRQLPAGGSVPRGIMTCVSTNGVLSTDVCGDFVGAHRQQRYRRSEGDPFRTKMGLRDLWQRACHPIHRDGHAGGSASECRLHSHGGSIC